MKHLAAGVVAICILCSAHAGAETIGFESLGPTDFFHSSLTLFEGDYRLSYVQGDGGFVQVASPANCFPTCTSNGSMAFYSFNEGSLVLSRIDGAPFSFLSLDAAQTFTTLNYALDFSITGITTISSILTAQFTTAPGGGDVFNTFLLKDFDNLLSATISGVPLYPTNEFAIDNLSVVSISTTPLPAALPLFATGLCVTGLLGWRRKRKNVAAIEA